MLLLNCGLCIRQREILKKKTDAQSDYDKPENKADVFIFCSKAEKSGEIT